jgi:hypothetical protein
VKTAPHQALAEIAEAMCDRGDTPTGTLVATVIARLLAGRHAAAFDGLAIPHGLGAADLPAWAQAHGGEVFAPHDCNVPGAIWPDVGDLVVLKCGKPAVLIARGAEGVRVFTAVELSGGQLVKHGRTFSEAQHFLRLTPRA